MTNTTITNLRQNIFEYINQAINYNDVINVSTKNGNAVIISEDEYNSLIETVQLLSVPGMKEKIIEGMNQPLDECIKYHPEEEW